jgi:hypothetical protein
MMWICREVKARTQNRIREEQENIARQHVYRLSIQSSGYVPSIKYGIVGKLNKDRQQAGTKLHKRRWVVIVDVQYTDIRKRMLSSMR